MKKIFYVLVMLFSVGSLLADIAANDEVIVPLSADDFTQVLFASDYTIVYFYSESCGCNKGMTLSLEKMAAKYENVYFAKVNGKVEDVLTQHYQITRFPTLLFFRNEELILKWAGSIAEKKLEQKIIAFLQK